MNSTKSHTDFCRQSRTTYYGKKAKFISHWPQHCKTCDGLGGKYTMDDPSPAGVGLGAGFFTEFEWCPDCLEINKCPRCGALLREFYEDGKASCWHCNWSEEEAEQDIHGEYCLPEKHECLCFAEEEYQETHEELEQLTELEVDLADDPGRQKRQDDADNALMFLIGRNDDNDEGD